MSDDVLELHPLAKLAFLQLTSKRQKGFELTAEGRERIVRALERLHESPDLRSAVVSLISLAKHVEDAGGVSAADALLSVAATACSALKKQGSENAKLAENLGEMTTKVFTAFSGREVVRAAPIHGERIKEGTISIAALSASKRKIIR